MPQVLDVSCANLGITNHLTTEAVFHALLVWSAWESVQLNACPVAVVPKETPLAQAVNRVPPERSLMERAPAILARHSRLPLAQECALAYLAERERSPMPT